MSMYWFTGLYSIRGIFFKWMEQSESLILLPLIASSNVTVPSISDKTAATAPGALISLVAARLAAVFMYSFLYSWFCYDWKESDWFRNTKIHWKKMFSIGAW